MPSGNKDYFRHSFKAHRDEFIVRLITETRLKEKGYYMYFTLLELCGELLASGKEFPLKFSESTLCRHLRCNKSTLKVFLTYCEGSSKVHYTYIEPTYDLTIPKLLEFYGKYSEKTTKEKKRKENKINKKYIQKTFSPPPHFATLIEVYGEYIKKHNLESQLIQKAYKKYVVRKKNYSDEEIIQAVKNYSSVLNSDNYFNYKWDLDEFLGRDNALKFYPDRFTKENFIENAQDQDAWDKSFEGLE